MVVCLLKEHKDALNKGGFSNTDIKNICDIGINKIKLLGEKYQIYLHNLEVAELEDDEVIPNTKYKDVIYTILELIEKVKEGDIIISQSQLDKLKSQHPTFLSQLNELNQFI